MTVFTSEIAIFAIADGALAVLAPTGTPLREGPAFVMLPPGYEDGLYQWNAETRQFVVNLAVARLRCWSAVKAVRDRAEWSGCVTALGRVDTDPDSQRKVSGSVQMAMIAQAAGAPFNLSWTMQDNRTVIHDAGAMIGMGIAVGQHVAACHAIAISKRAAIDAAETVEAVAAVDIEGGWPDA